MSMKQRFCRVCGQPFRFVRFDSQVCTTTSGMRKIRGFDLAYLTELPPDQACARRSVHAAIDDEIFVMKLATASRREGRATRRNLPQAKRMKISGGL
jgi:hypothetical protein